MQILFASFRRRFLYHTAKDRRHGFPCLLSFIPIHFWAAFIISRSHARGGGERRCISCECRENLLHLRELPVRPGRQLCMRERNGVGCQKYSADHGETHRRTIPFGAVTESPDSSFEPPGDSSWQIFVFFQFWCSASIFHSLNALQYPPLSVQVLQKLRDLPQKMRPA